MRQTRARTCCEDICGCSAEKWLPKFPKCLILLFVNSRWWLVLLTFILSRNRRAIIVSVHWTLLPMSRNINNFLYFSNKHKKKTSIAQLPSDWSKNIFSLTYNFSAVSRIIWVFYSFPYSLYIILLHDQSHCPIACQIFSKYWTRHCPDWSLASTIGDFLDVLCLKRILSLFLQFFSSFF